MKILQVVHSFVPYTIAGTEVYTYKLSKELAKRNEVSVFFRIKHAGQKEYYLNQDNLEDLQTYAINHTFNKCNSFRETYDDKKIDNIFGDLLDRIKPDVIHIHHLLFISLGIVLEAKKRNIPTVFTLHDYWLICHRGQLIRDKLALCSNYDESNCRVCLKSQLSIRKNTMFFYNLLRENLPNPFLQLIKKLYVYSVNNFISDTNNLNDSLKERSKYVSKVISEVDLFISPSNFLRDKFLEFGIPRNKIIYSPYGVDHSSFQLINKIKTDLFRLGYIGTLLPMKGLTILIEAFKRIKCKNIKLIIFGRLFPYTGYEGYVKFLEHSFRKDKRIEFMGEFDNKNVGTVFNNFDILVVPSLWPENSPFVIQEAFLARKPVIASRIGGIPELITEGVNGLLFNPADPNDLHEKIQYLIENPGIIEKFRENTPMLKNIEDNAKDMENIYNNLVNNRS